MINFRIEDNYVIATYSTNAPDIKWLFEKFEDGEKYAFQKTFTFSQKDIYKSEVAQEEDEEGELDDFDEQADPVDFLFAEKVGEYYKVVRGVLVNNFDIYLHESVNIFIDLFVAEGNVSILGQVEDLINEDVYIGGNHPKHIEEEKYLGMTQQFPTPYEKKLYAQARVSAVVKEFFSSAKDAEVKFNRYLNKKVTRKGSNLIKAFQESELHKFETIHQKLLQMLNDENGYNEKQWQKEILQIVLLLYPKYLYVFEEVVIVTDDGTNKRLDFLLVDYNGNTDIIEIKKPFENSIMTTNSYRDNYIPLRELTGTVMQIEKYIYYLNRWSIRGERKLTEVYKDNLPEGFEIKITNPNGLIIMGRENNLAPLQIRDFEVVKRKFKNVVDIITYDNLLQRLQFMIEHLRKL